MLVIRGFIPKLKAYQRFRYLALHSSNLQCEYDSMKSEYARSIQY